MWVTLSILLIFSLFFPGQSLGQERSNDMAEVKMLTQSEGRVLIQVARDTIRARLFGLQFQLPEGIPPSLKEKRGTFVTITIDGQLRGCIGHILPVTSIIEGVKENAINAAFRDPRFPPLSRDEFDRIKIEVSVLTFPVPLQYKDAQDLLNKLRPNVDGVIIKKGFHQATFLPQVWEQLPEKKEFLTHLCLKAGLEPDAWKQGSLEVQTYQVQAFHEE